MRRLLWPFVAGAFLSSATFGKEPDAELAALSARLADLEERAQRLDETTREMERLRGELRDLRQKLAAGEERPIPLPPVAATVLPDVEEPVAAPAAAQDAAASVSTEPEMVEPTPTDPWPPADEAGAAADSGDGYGEGLQYGFWGWLTYYASPQKREQTFWAWEFELNFTKSFTEQIAASADVDWVDTNNGAKVSLEQLFLSFLIPSWNDAILTAGKFNAPYGIERRDFWDRETASTTLLFRALPQDLTGLMLTQHWTPTNFITRAFVVNGFGHNLDINQQPSVGLMVEYRLHEDFSLASTNWWGPEFQGNNHDKLYFTLAQGTWRPWPLWSVSGEFLYGTTEAPGGRKDWSGYAMIVGYDLFTSFRLVVQWSDRKDGDAFFSSTPRHRQQASAGFSWHLHRQVEARCEYRHNIDRNLPPPGDEEESDEVGAHLTFGY